MHTRGYVYIKKPEHPFSDKRGYIFEHRLVMEQSLGRYLTSKEVVHHKNGDKADNRAVNLELITQGEHLSKHGLTWGHSRVPWNKSKRFGKRPYSRQDMIFPPE